MVILKVLMMMLAGQKKEILQNIISKTWKIGLDKNEHDCSGE